MIRIGFFLTPTKGWMGGVNYFKNLLLAISFVQEPRIQIYLMVPSNVDEEVLQMIVPTDSDVKVVRTKLLQRMHPLWVLWRIWRKLFGSELVARILTRRYRLDVVAHSDFFRGAGVAVINWLPDFQHMHLPKMFEVSDLKSRIKRYAVLAREADSIVVSSEDAKNDLRKALPNVVAKVKVLRFVSSPPASYWSLQESDRDHLLKKYGLRSSFFYVPNQFWQHKNHKVLLHAIEIATKRGIAVQIVCSGSTNDHRQPEHFANLKRLAEDLSCGNSLRILGVIPYKDVFGLIKFCEAVINPSKFEGWSSTVEECKAVGKQVLLSDLAVHREQAPQARFFNPDSAEELVELLQEIQICKTTTVDQNAKLETINHHRSAEYGLQFIEIATEAIAAKQGKINQRREG
jgi:glycosyltransferase involved in cell wall biosynthesis